MAFVVFVEMRIGLRKGEYPKIEVSNTKKNKSIYGFLNIKNGTEHSFIKYAGLL